jgi:hypothetical protein
MPAIEQLSNSGEIAQFYDEERLFDIDQFQEYMDLDHDHRSVSQLTFPCTSQGRRADLVRSSCSRSGGR